jgi:thiol-disulfide isomerase/thioredoxin
MKIWHIIFIITLISLALAILSGAINWPNQFVIGGLAYFTAGLLYHRKFVISRFLYGLIVVIPFVLIYTAHALIQHLVHVYPIAFWPPVAIVVGLLINKMHFNKVKKSSSIITFVLLIMFLGYLIIPNWLVYIHQSKYTVKQEVPEICFSTKDGASYCLNNQKGKVIVLDFWSTGCAVCFKKFPELEKMKEHYSNRDDLDIFAVNLLLRRDHIDSIHQKAENLPYSFNHLFTLYEQAKEIRKTLKINGVPTLVIIDKNSEILYVGGLNTKKHIILDNAYNIIDDALKD